MLSIGKLASMAEGPAATSQDKMQGKLNMESNPMMLKFSSNQLSTIHLISWLYIILSWNNSMRSWVTLPTLQWNLESEPLRRRDASFHQTDQPCKM